MPSHALPVSFYFLLLCGLIAANVNVYRDILLPHALEMRIFAAGKSDVALIRTPQGKTVLIDTGPDTSILRALGEALPEWQRSLDAVILTSATAAQTGGLASTNTRYEVGEVLRAGTVELPYGTHISTDNVSITIIAPGRTDISYGVFSLTVSSTTPVGVYRSDGEATVQS